MKKQWIGIEEAAEKYQVSSKRIHTWCEKKEIISSKIDYYLMLDENSLEECLERHKQLSLSDHEFKCRMNKIIGENEEEVFILQSMKELTPIIRLVIKELAGMIQNDNRRRLFLYIALKGSIREYSDETCYDYYKVRTEFESVLREIKSRAGFLKIHKDEMIQLKSILRLYEKKYGKEMLIEDLKKIKEVEASALKEKKEAIELLKTPISKLNFDMRSERVLTKNGIHTLHDLLQITYKYGFGRLCKLPDFGPVGQRRVINQLKILNIVDDELISYLYKYMDE